MMPISMFTILVLALTSRLGGAFFDKILSGEKILGGELGGGRSASVNELDNCTWPQCTPTCDPCGSRVLSTCYLNYLSEDWFGCQHFFKHSSCFLTRCMCEEGFCAYEVNGRLQCVYEHCDGGGARPPKFQQMQLGEWLLTVAGIDPKDEKFPTPEILFENPEIYILDVAIPLPLGMLVAGVIISSFYVYLSFCGRGMSQFYKRAFIYWKGKRRFNLGRKKKAVAKETEKIFPGWHCPSKRHYEGRLCGSGFLFVLILVISAFTLFDSAFFIVTASRHAQNSLQEVITEFNSTVGIRIRDLTVKVNSLFTNVTELAYDCGNSSTLGGGAQGKIQDLYHSVEGDLNMYNEMIMGYLGNVEAVPELLLQTKSLVANVAKTALWFAITPLALVCFLALGVFASVFVIRCEDNIRNSIRSMIHYMLIYAPCFVFIMLTASVAASLGFFVSTSISHFCTNPEVNAWEYVRWFQNDSMVEQISDHYLLGRRINPIVEYVNLAEKYMDNVEYQYWKFRPHVDAVEWLCLAANGLDLEPIFTGISSTLDTARGILEGPMIWKAVGDSLFRRSLCTDFNLVLVGNSLGQYFVGVILAPLCAYFAHRYLYYYCLYKDDELADELTAGAREELEEEARQELEEEVGDEPSSSRRPLMDWQ